MALKLLVNASGPAIAGKSRYEMSVTRTATWRILCLGLPVQQRRQTALIPSQTISRIFGTLHMSTPIVSTVRSLLTSSPQCSLHLVIPSRCAHQRRQWFLTATNHFSRRSLRPQLIRGATKFQASRSENRIVPLSQDAIIALFGQAMRRDDGNFLLAKLQKHRQEGTLDSKIDFPSRSIATGLQYLRSKYPMDEDAAINTRVDRELAHEFRLPQTNTEQSPYAHSGLEKIRRENTERHEREKASQGVKTTAGSSESKAVATKPRTLRNLVQRSEKEPEWVRRYREKAQSTEMPQISTIRRLLYPGLFTVVIVASSILFAQNYTPPSQQARMFPDLPPAAATLIAILGINLSVFILWKIPPMWAFMNKYFICVPLRPRAAQMLCTGFSHQELAHLLVNIIPMWFIGVRCRF